MSSARTVSEFASFDLLERQRNHLESLFDGVTSVSDDLWQHLEDKAKLAASIRTISGYENACGCLLLLRQVAQWTGQDLRFNTTLSDFRKQHQTKSMLIALVNRQVDFLCV